MQPPKKKGTILTFVDDSCEKGGDFTRFGDKQRKRREKFAPFSHRDIDDNQSGEGDANFHPLVTSGSNLAFAGRRQLKERRKFYLPAKNSRKGADFTPLGDGRKE